MSNTVRGGLRSDLCRCVGGRGRSITTHVARSPPARMLVENTDGRNFVLLDEPRAGFALVVENGPKWSTRELLRPQRSPWRVMCTLVAGGEAICVLRLSIEESTAAATDGQETTAIRVSPALHFDDSACNVREGSFEELE